MRPNDNIIVIADDDVEICDSFATLFEARGYEVHTCNDGLAAVALCKEVRPGVALIDLEMPGIDGYEVARRLRADVDLAETRLVEVTGRSDEQGSALACASERPVTATRRVSARSTSARRRRATS
jgi:CheY-like chemotaxis protein